jgi:hypothetical protein
MKKIIIALVFIMGLTSCDNNDDQNTNNSNVIAITETLTVPSGFRINQFTEDGVDKTNLFSSYVFVFNSNGAVTATNSDGVINGTYLVFRDDNRTELSMTFPNIGEFFELTDDWYFDFQNDTFIRFADGGDIIEFEKL